MTSSENKNSDFCYIFFHFLAEIVRFRTHVLTAGPKEKEKRQKEVNKKLKSIRKQESMIRKRLVCLNMGHVTWLK